MNIKKIKNITSYGLVCTLLSSNLLGTTVANAYENIDNSSTNKTIINEKELRSTTMMVVTSDTLNVRVKADASAKKVGEFKEGDKVEVVSTLSNGWCKVKYENDYGYVNGSYLSNLNTESEEALDSNTYAVVTHTGVVTSTTLNVRVKADASSKKIGAFKKGEKVEIVAKASNGWYKVKYKNQYGYLNGGYLKNIKSVTTSNNNNTTIKVTHTGIVTSDTLNVRVKADASSKKIGAFKKGEKVEIVAKASNGWYKVKYKNQYGYLNGGYLKNIKSVTTSNNESNTDKVDKDIVIRTGIISIDTAEVKKEASTESEVIGSLTKDSRIEIVNMDLNGWYKIKFNNDYGYIQSESVVLNRNTNTSISGLKTSISQTAGKSLSDSIEVTSAYGRNVKLQMYNTSNKKWETKATFKTDDVEKASVKLKYPSQWYNQVASKWRVVIDAKDDLKKYTSKTINVTAKRVYENPKGYIQLKEKITLSGGGKNLVKGSMGLRVAKVQRKLGMGRIWEKVDTKTMNKVKAFQSKHGIKATGVVDLKTWKKLGFSESEWYNLDAYATPVKTKLTATREDLIEQMIATAESYLGTEYVVGASGKPGTGIDCSGLVMQALYSIGIDPAPISPVRHAQPGYEYESRNLWNLSTLKTVSKPKRGDLVFYKNSKGVIIHVAIYLGNNRVIESWPEKVVNWPLIHSSRPLIKGYKRVLG